MTQREDGPIPEKYALWEAIENEGVQWLVYSKRPGLLSLIDSTAIGILSRTRVVSFFVDVSKIEVILTNFKACPGLMKQAVVSSQMRWEWERPSLC